MVRITSFFSFSVSKVSKFLIHLPILLCFIYFIIISLISLLENYFKWIYEPWCTDFVNSSGSIWTVLSISGTTKYFPILSRVYTFFYFSRIYRIHNIFHKVFALFVSFDFILIDIPKVFFSQSSRISESHDASSTPVLKPLQQ